MKQLIIDALTAYKGDNAKRAREAFRAFSPEQMSQMYGRSGRTHQEVLDGYEKHERAVQEAINWVKMQSGIN